MEPLNASNDPIESLTINEITCEIDSNQVNTKLAQTSKFTQNSHCTQNESTKEQNPCQKPQSLCLIPFKYTDKYP